MSNTKKNTFDYIQLMDTLFDYIKNSSVYQTYIN